MTSERPYRYKPLLTPLQIRLVDILPGSDGQPLSCRIREVQVEDKHVYEALSYVWGDEKDKVAIQCEDANIYITQNLTAALRYFRHSSEPRTLWVDSICINQESAKEKSQQIPLMGVIYSAAVAVRIWLGHENECEDTNKAWNLMRVLEERIYPQIEKLRSQYEGMETKPVDPEELEKEFNLPLIHSSEFLALRDFYKRPWFSRAWTFQESFLARQKTFHCGNYSASETLLLRTALSLTALGKITNDGRYTAICISVYETALSVKNFMKIKTYYAPEFFKAVVLKRRGSRCKIPHDHVYSILGIFPEISNIKPNYSAPLEIVFAQVAAYIITSTKSLSLLSEVDSVPRMLALPSWVPDWTKEKEVTVSFICPFGKWVRLREPVYSCTGSSHADVRISEDFKELIVQGLAWDEITLVHDDPAQLTDPRIVEQLFGTRWPESLYKYYQKFIIDDKSTETCLEPGENIQPVQDKVSVSGRLQGKRLVVTRNQRLGMASEDVLPGDEVVFLLGAAVPILIRPENDKYKFVGEAYFPGYMSGEALVDARKREQPDYHDSDTTWLQRLHVDIPPLGIRSFTIK